MTRLKKSRKSGPIGVRKQETRPADTKSDVRKKKKPKGQKSGNRNSFLVEKKEKLERIGKHDSLQNKVEHFMQKYYLMLGLCMVLLTILIFLNFSEITESVQKIGE